MIPKVISVKPLDNYKLELEFVDSIRIFDLTPYLDKPMFKSLTDLEKFKEVRVAFNTIVWDNGADFDPESVYKLSQEKLLEDA